ncbi:MAG: hypothetical protein V1901_03775 [Patescibacteria group bacterium]
MANNKLVDLFKLMKDQGNLTKVWVYPGTEIENDPNEHTKDITFLNPIAIKALVFDESFSSLKFKYYGTIPYGSKKIVCEKKYENLLKLARRLKIEEENYIVYKDADRGFSFIKQNAYILCIAEKINL